jgi:hypothetical protein
MKKILSWFYIVGIAAIATYVLVNQFYFHKLFTKFLDYGFWGAVLTFVLVAFFLWLAFTTVYVMRKMLDIIDKEEK